MSSIQFYFKRFSLLWHLCCPLQGWWFGGYTAPVCVCPLAWADALCSRHSALLLVMGCCWDWKKLFLAGLLCPSLTQIFWSANAIASIVIVFIASLGVVRLTSRAAAEIDTSKQHNSLIPWKLLFQYGVMVPFYLPSLSFKRQNCILFTAGPRTCSLLLLHAQSQNNPLDFLFPWGLSWLEDSETSAMQGGAVQLQYLTFLKCGPLQTRFLSRTTSFWSRLLWSWKQVQVLIAEMSSFQHT